MSFSFGSRSGQEWVRTLSRWPAMPKLLVSGFAALAQIYGAVGTGWKRGRLILSHPLPEGL